MILEVNNTFGERRIYLLHLDAAQSTSGTTNQFSQKWPKDFHVSPFNSRKGAYSLSTSNAFRNGYIISPGIDNIIVLKSSKDHTKLFARLVSSDVSIDMDNASLSCVLPFVIQWAWLGFFTFPRILKEAFVLFFSRKLHVWLRPEVQASSLARDITSMERSVRSIWI